MASQAIAAPSGEVQRSVAEAISCFDSDLTLPSGQIGRELLDVILTENLAQVYFVLVVSTNDLLCGGIERSVDLRHF